MRVVIFTDVAAAAPRRLIEAVTDAARRHRALDVAGFVTCEPATTVPSRSRSRIAQARRGLVRATGGGRSDRPLDLGRLARDAEQPVLVPAGSPNEPAFVERLQREVRPDAILSLFCLRILRPPLLDSVELAVNYHDGLLPQYGGLAATSHSMYDGVDRTGFTFHHMTPAIDEGPTLLQGSVAVGVHQLLDEVVRAKTARAVASVPELLDLMVARDAGTPQSGPRRYRSLSALEAITVIDRPGEVAVGEVHRRLRTFGAVHIPIEGRWHYVTAVAPARRVDRLSFACSDGRLRATRLGELPPAIVRSIRTMRRR